MTRFIRFHLTLSLGALVFAPALLAQATPDAKAIAAPYADSGLFIAGDGCERQASGHWRIVRDLAF